MSDDFNFTLGEPEDDLMLEDTEAMAELLEGYDLTGGEEPLTLDGPTSELSLEDDDVAFDVGGGDPLVMPSSVNDEELSDALLLRSTVDIVSELTAYRQCTNAFLVSVAPMDAKVSSDSLAFALSNAEFPYMPENVFRVFHKILTDLAVKPEYQYLTVEECVPKSLELIMEATPWTPKLNSDAYAASFVKWCSRFRKLAGSVVKIDENDVRTLLDMDVVRMSDRVFAINTNAFMLINTFLEEPTDFSKSVPVDTLLCGILCSSYMQQHRTRQFTLAMVRDIVLTYFNSGSAASTLHVTQEELMNFSSGEIARRLLQYELASGMMYPVGLRGRPVPDTAAMIQLLKVSMESGSVVAELLGIIAAGMFSSPKRAVKVMFDRFLEGLQEYLLGFLENSSLINPAFYGHAVQNGDVYSLSYVVGEETRTIQTNSPLCEVVGTKVSAHCIPTVCIDEVSGYAVCPPPQLVTSLRSVSLSGKMKVSGGVKFSFKPTVGWLTKNHVLAEDITETEEVKQGGLEGGSNTLLEALLNYDNEFASNYSEVRPAVVTDSKDGYTIFAVPRTIEEGGYFVPAVAVRSSGYSHPVAKDGLMVLDDAQQSVIVQSPTLDGKGLQLTVSNAECEIEEISVPIEEQGGDLGFSALLLDIRKVAPFDDKGYQESVERLCAMSSLDYEDELRVVQDILSCDLYYVLRIFSVDGLVASRVLQAYQKYREGRRAQGFSDEVDLVNFGSLKELVDIVVGKPNDLEGLKQWEPSVGKYLDTTVQSSVLTISQVCQFLLETDLSVIALQALCVGQTGREVNREMYLAFRSIPGVAKIVRRLENEMVALKVLDTLGDGVVSLFSRNTVMTKVFAADVSSETVDMLHYTLVEKMKKKLDVGDTYTLPLTRQVLRTAVSESAATIKYLILERNAYNLLTTLELSEQEYEQLYRRMLRTLGWDETVKVSEMTAEEFKVAVPEVQQRRLFTEHYKDLIAIVREGLISEIVVENRFPIVKAFDMFNTFYPVLMGVKGGVKQDLDYSDFIAYAASMVLSYCPVVDNAASSIDGGTDRAQAFSSDPNDFVYDGDLSQFSGYELKDMRLIVGGM